MCTDFVNTERPATPESEKTATEENEVSMQNWHHFKCCVASFIFRLLNVRNTRGT